MGQKVVDVSKSSHTPDTQEQRAGGSKMLEMDLLHEAFRHRRERIEESDRAGESREKRPSPKDRVEDPSLIDAAQKALDLIEKAPDIRRDRVEEIKKGLEAGSLKFDSKLIADRLLQESILNELL